MWENAAWAAEEKEVMNMKRLHIVAGLLLVTLLLSACGDAPETTAPAEEEAALETAAPVEAAEEPAPAPQKEPTTPEEPAVSEETPSAPQQEPAPQPPVEQPAPVQQDPAPANNNTGSSGNSGSTRTGSVVINGKTVTGVRYFDSVDQLNGVAPTKENEKVSVGGVPYTWTGYEWADYSGFSTEVIYHNEGELSGELVGY